LTSEASGDAGVAAVFFESSPARLSATSLRQSIDLGDSGALVLALSNATEDAEGGV
jgi:hypothetical protein